MIVRKQQTSNRRIAGHSAISLWATVSLFALFATPFASAPAYSQAGLGGGHLYDLNDDLDSEFDNYFETEVEGEIEELVENEIESRLEDEVTAEVELVIQEAVGGQVERELLEHHLEFVEEELELRLDDLYEDERNALFTDTWLVMGDMESILALREEGYVITNVETLDGLGYVLGAITAPQTHQPGELGLASIEILDSPLLSVDVNARYLPQTTSGGTLAGPATEVAPISRATTRIGIIDSRVADGHPAFRGASISQASFVPEGMAESQTHGTAIASVLVGEAENFQGLVPHARLMIGSVFGHGDDGKIFATTAAVVRALDWLTRDGVKVVNMSMAGPDNFILKRAIEAACDNGVTVVASVGNSGPTSSPQYPAAYDCTIGVTAVDASSKVYHRAGRGDHVDFASYGVNVPHALDGGGYSVDSGTSYAAAVVSAIVASDVEPLQGHELSRRQLILRAKDLGKPGHDNIYGFGLLTPASLIAGLSPQQQ